MKALTTLIVIGMFTTAVAMADDADDVRVAVLRHYAALNAGDADAYIRSRAPQHSLFSGTNRRWPAFIFPVRGSFSRAISFHFMKMKAGHRRLVPRPASFTKL